MTSMTEKYFLNRASAAAAGARHIWPDYAACEAALESSWGTSRLAIEANNLFGQKQVKPPVGGTFTLPTMEFIEGSWVEVTARWMTFPDWTSSFAQRMHALTSYPEYKEALEALTGEQFIEEVSKRWSTDPQRSAKVMEIYNEHF